MSTGHTPYNATPHLQYWEPAKHAAVLRHVLRSNTSSSSSSTARPICLKMDMTSGHFSASDRYKYLKEMSFEYAFLLDQLGLAI